MTASPDLRPTSKPVDVVSDTLGNGERLLIALFIAVPLLAVAAAVPVAWGGWLSWTDVILATISYVIGGLGITIGYHRLFTHGSFRANEPVVVGGVESAEIGYIGSGTDFSIYSSTPPPV